MTLAYPVNQSRNVRWDADFHYLTRYENIDIKLELN